MPRTLEESTYVSRELKCFGELHLFFNKHKVYKQNEAESYMIISRITRSQRLVRFCDYMNGFLFRLQQLLKKRSETRLIRWGPIVYVTFA